MMLIFCLWILRFCRRKNGINLINYLHKHHPNLYILVMSSFYSASSVSMALRNGARGFIHKQASEAEMINAVKVVGSGNVYLELEMAVLLAQLHYAEMQASSRHAPPTQEASRVSLSSLSPKVQEVIHGLLEGMTVKEIAQKYGRSIKTISGQKQTGIANWGLNRIENFIYCAIIWTTAHNKHKSLTGGLSNIASKNN
jgi:DNA-binding NarL/FixJ family response regulator